MPTYSYNCENCNLDFELFFTISSYDPSPKCVGCKSKKTQRLYIKDVATQSTSIKKLDSELKTIGDLANRNRDKLSSDEKAALDMKHNEYKYDTKELKDLPSGMSRVTKKKDKIKWPGSIGKQRRKLNGK